MEAPGRLQPERWRQARRASVLRHAGAGSRRLGTGQRQLVAAFAEPEGQLQHGLGGPGPLPVAGDLEDLHAAGSTGRTRAAFPDAGTPASPRRSSSHNVAYFKNTWNADAAAMAKPGKPSRKPAFSR